IRVFQRNDNGTNRGCTPPLFCMLFDKEDANPFRNYAVPLVGNTPHEEDIEALIAELQYHKRMPRLESMPELVPRLRELLRTSGFVEEGMLPLMAYCDE